MYTVFATRINVREFDTRESEYQANSENIFT